MERYHASLRQAYQIIHAEISQKSSELCLSIVIKVMNNTTESNNLVLTLLVFETYLRISEILVLSSSILIRAIAIHKAMKELSNLRA